MQRTHLLPWSEATRRLVERRAVFDAHADSIGRAVDLGVDLGKRGTEGHLDLVRGREGGLGVWVVVCWVDPEEYVDAPFRRANAMIDAARALEARHGDAFRIVGNAQEMEAAQRDRVLAGVLGIEGGHALEEDLANLEHFHRRGLRVLTLVWNNHLPWIRSCQPGAGDEIPEGLSDFGRDVVGRMNELGIVVDLSHAGMQSVRDVLAVSERPCIASHSGCHALHDHPRNLRDVELRALAEGGGVVGIVFHPGFLDAEARAEEGRVRSGATYRSLAGRDSAHTFELQRETMQRLAKPMPAERLIAHVRHAVNVAGIDHVGIGSDYDGIQRGPAGLEDASCYGTLAELLFRDGFSTEHVEKILGGNLRRLFAEVTGQAQEPAAAAEDRRIRNAQAT